MRVELVRLELVCSGANKVRFLVKSYMRAGMRFRRLTLESVDTAGFLLR